MKRVVLIVSLGLIFGCSDGSGPVAGGPGGGGTSNPSQPDAGDSPECQGDGFSAPPFLHCTGLYADIATKETAPGVREYAPATPLWSDGADKRRWVYLPPGSSIDASSRVEWQFPVGTKFWKEFSVDGKRIETRLFQKVRSDRWLSATYAWSEDELDAVSSQGGDIDLNGAPYYIPKASDCSDCHKGRLDSILGFEEISLGTPGANGVTLANLVEEGLLSPPPPGVEYVIPDDGTEAAAPALAWLHINCGVTCHNVNSRSTGNGTGLYLRLDPGELEAASPVDWDPLRTSLRISAITPKWTGETRVIPGAPERSLLVRLISLRGDEQMPPIATRVTDDAAIEWVSEWIRRMPHTVDDTPPPPPPEEPLRVKHGGAQSILR